MLICPGFWSSSRSSSTGAPLTCEAQFLLPLLFNRGLGDENSPLVRIFSDDAKAIISTVHTILASRFSGPLSPLASPRANHLIIFSLLVMILDVLQPEEVGGELVPSVPAQLDLPKEGVDEKEIAGIDRMFENYIPLTPDLISLFTDNKLAAQPFRKVQPSKAGLQAPAPKVAPQDSTLEHWFFWQFDDQQKIAKFVLESVIREENFAGEIDRVVSVFLGRNSEATIDQLESHVMANLPRTFQDLFAVRLASAVSALSPSSKVLFLFLVRRFFLPYFFLLLCFAFLLFSSFSIRQI